MPLACRSRPPSKCGASAQVVTGAAARASVAHRAGARPALRGDRDALFAEWAQIRHVFSVINPTAVYVLAMPFVGLYVGSAVFIAYFMRALGKYGWIAAFVYCSGAALRLARFNTNIAVVDKRFFQGLPSPAAAALVMGLIWVVTDLGETAFTLTGMVWLTFAMTLYAGLTMVTNIPFYSFKDVNFRRSVPFIAIVAIALGIAVITIHPPIVLFAVFVLYGLSGYGVYAWKRMKGKRVSVISTSTDEPEEAGLHR